MMGVERIHACPNHCILYVPWGYFRRLGQCSICSASRYKKNIRSCVDDDIQGTSGGSKRSRKGASINVATVEPQDTTVSGSEKTSKIPFLVMWYLPVVGLP
jgi:hypothetical protein